MVKIISDTCTLYSKEEASKIGLEIVPLNVIVDGKDYKEYQEIDTKALLEKINKGAIPTSSQPSIGEKIEAYDLLAKDDDVIDITIAQGLSGTYDSALMAKDACEYPDRVEVFNSKTLCGPQRALVEEALKMANDGRNKEDIVKMLEHSSHTDISFLIPMDFKFLERGGRVSKTVGNIGSFFKLVICLKKSDDGKCLEKHSINRTIKGAVNSIIKELIAKGVDHTYRFYITHAMNEDLANKIRSMIVSTFPNASIETHILSPVFTAQGGPGCCALQAIKIVY